jgi:RNA polymerase sigma-70 factor (ECF subfamily)
MVAKTEAFLSHVRHHGRRLYVAARQYVAAGDAHDLVQETLLRAWKNFSVTDERTFSRAWLFVILRNIAREWHRTATRRVRIVPQSSTELTEFASSELNEAFAVLPSMSEAHFYEFLDDRLVAALEELDPPNREVVVLSVAGGLNYREIGEVLDCPMGTVMSRMARARRALRERLAEFAVVQNPTRGGRQ